MSSARMSGARSGGRRVLQPRAIPFLAVLALALVGLIASTILRRSGGGAAATVTRRLQPPPVAAVASVLKPLRSAEAQMCELRRRLFPRASALNAARVAWKRSRSDWHDLIPETKNRGDRERAKTRLLSLLRGEDGPAALREDCGGDSGGVAGTDDGGYGNGGTQAAIVEAARVIAMGAHHGDAKMRADAPSREPTCALVRAVADEAAAAALADSLGLDADDVTAHRAETGSAARHGPLAKLHACGKIRDACMLHLTARACVDDEHCGWCEASGGVGGVCASRLSPFKANRAAGQPVRTCAAGRLLVTAASVPSLRGPSAPVVERLRLSPRQKKHGLELSLIKSLTECTFVVTRRRPLLLAFADANSKMAYHFFGESAPLWMRATEALGGLDFLNADVYVPRAVWSDLPGVVLPFTESCPRILEDVQDFANVTICYEKGTFAASTLGRLNPMDGDVGAESAFGLPSPALARIPFPPEAGGAVDGAELAPDFELESVIESVRLGKRLGLMGLVAVAAQHVAPTAGELLKKSFADSKRRGDGFQNFVLSSLLLLSEEGSGARHLHGAKAPLVTLISRRDKRFLLNEATLVRVALALGARVKVATLEDMPLYEQALLLRRTDVLVGVHGSGLINSFFMRPGSAVLQIVPLGVKGASSFFEPPAMAAQVAYLELDQRAPPMGVSLAAAGIVAHPHFLASGDYEALLRSPKGSEAVEPSTFFSYFINQDFHVDAMSFAEALRRAIAAAGWAGQPDCSRTEY